MGLGAELMDEALCNYYLQEDLQLNRTSWTTRDGRKLKIVDMETDHIENTIKYLSNHGKTVPKLMYETLKVRSMVK